MAELVLTDRGDFEVPREIAICPYCNATLSVNVEAWELHGDGWRASEITIDCHGEPPTDGNAWDDWNRQHSAMPYVYQLPVDLKVLDWINSHYRFCMGEGKRYGDSNR